MLDAVYLNAASESRLHDRFVQCAAFYPEHVAVQAAGQTLTYRELDQRSNQLARLLHDRGLRPSMFAGICLDRTPELIIAIIAILKTGAAYVPIDPAYPDDRRAFILSDSNISFLITRRPLIESHEKSFQLFDIDEEQEALSRTDAAPLGALDRIIDPDQNLACLFYTSGSTGRPKGVMLRHSATRMIDWAATIFPNGELDCVAATTSICFDPSIFEIFAPLSLGGRLLIKQDLLEPFAADEHPTLLNGVPSAFAELARRKLIPSSVRVVNVGGERLRAELARDIYECAQVAQVWNHYGPTETTICASAALVARTATDDPPIGQPIAGALMYVLDESGQTVRDGQTGELFIGGPSVAAGYLNQPQLTAQKFLADPFVPGGRMYRTGDLVRRASNGNLFFVVRTGRQVKIRGFRIELDDIETALMSLPDIVEAAVIADNRDSGADYLSAFVVSNNAMTLPMVRRQLQDRLPHYMLPARLMLLPHMPLTPSGKVDHAALVALDPPLSIETMPDLSPFEEAIVNIYRDLLEDRSFGPDDDFFDCGGDSLMALAAVERLEQVLGLSVPVSMLYHGRTPSALAVLIANQRSSANSLVTLQSSGDDTPIFCVPDLYGRPTSFISLARHFRGERPVYGLAIGAMEAEFTEKRDVSVLTGSYIETIKTIQPQGPYLIMGYSAGGIPAIDLANALRDAGNAVTLVLLDPRAQRFMTDLPFKRHQLIQAIGAAWKGGVRAGRKAFFRMPPPEWAPRAYADITAAWLDAEAAWSERAFEGPSILVRCPDPGGPMTKWINVIARLLSGYESGWHAILRGPCLSRRYDIDHAALMREPFVMTMTDWLKQELAAR